MVVPAPETLPTDENLMPSVLCSISKNALATSVAVDHKRTASLFFNVAENERKETGTVVVYVMDKDGRWEAVALSFEIKRFTDGNALSSVDLMSHPKFAAGVFIQLCTSAITLAPLRVMVVALLILALTTACVAEIVDEKTPPGVAHVVAG